MGLHELGLGVIFDVVYNHTSHSRSSERAVLDRIVPGYSTYRFRGLPATVVDG
jgi:pullulanase/glycogen debranching enzyme